MKLFKKLFGKKEVAPERVDYETLHAEEEARKKAEWETSNNFKKKQDSAYLGTKKTAFYGSYEDYVIERDYQAYRRLANYNNASQLQSNAMSGTNSYNSYGIGQSIFGSAIRW